MLEIGRDDKGQVVGVADAARLMEELPNKLRDLLGIVADIDLLYEHGKPYVRIKVEPYPVPISYRGEYHYRSGSTKQVLSGAALDRFLLSRTGKRWDGVPVPGVSVGDLDAASVESYPLPESALREAVLNAVVHRDYAKETTQETQETTQETTQEAQETAQKRILSLLRAEPELTRNALADRLGITSDGVKYHLDKLREAGRIRHVGPTKKGRWEVVEDGLE